MCNKMTKAKLLLLLLLFLLFSVQNALQLWMLRCYNKWRRYTGLRSQNDDHGVLTLPALLGGRTARFARKRLVVFGFGGSLEHSDGEQDAHKGETP